MAANLTTTYASQILDLLGLSKFKGGNAPPCLPDKNIPVHGLSGPLDSLMDIFYRGGGRGGIAPPWILTTKKGPTFCISHAVRLAAA